MRERKEKDGQVSQVKEKREIRKVFFFFNRVDRDLHLP